MLASVHMTRGLAAVPAILLFCGSCSDPGASKAEATRAAGPAAVESAASADWFTDGAAAAGLDFVHVRGATGRFYYPEILPPGVGLVDYDNDGDLDV